MKPKNYPPDPQIGDQVDVNQTSTSNHHHFKHITSSPQLQVSNHLKPSVLVYPSEFQRYRQWVVWRLEWDDERSKFKKVPYDPHTLLHASPTNSSTWSDFQTAYQVAQETGMGLGFVLTDEDPYAVLDFDGILEDEEMYGKYFGWLMKHTGFIEISQSNKGLHFFFKLEGAKPDRGRRSGKIEFYPSKRFIAMTGKVWNDKFKLDCVKWDELIKIFSWVETEKFELPQGDEPKNINPQDSSTVDQDVVEQVAQKVERKHPDLWNGSWESKHPSQSEADLALMNSIVSVWRKETGRIPTLQEAVAVFHRSELGSREKAYRMDYLQRTFEKALEVLDSVDKKDEKEVVKVQERKPIIKTAKDKRDRIKRAKLVQNLLDAGVFDDVAYDPEFDKFYRWNEKQYVEINENELKRRIQEIAQQEREVIMDDTLSAVVKTLKTLVPVYSIAEPPYLIPVENGVLIPVRKQGDVIEFNFEPHDPSHGNTYIFPVKYDPTAKCEKWIQFLNEVVPAEEDRILLQEYIGYMLIPLNQLDLQKSLFIIGSGANGKSVFAKVVNILLGKENVANLRFDQMHGFQLEALVGKIANISTEVVAGSKYVDTSTWKQIITGDKITVNPKYRQPFSYKPIAKHLYAINEPPRISDPTDGTWRRILIVRFPVRIPPEKQNPYLVDELKEELSGILNWALEGLARVLMNGDFTSTALERSEKLVKEWRISENVVELWWQEHVKPETESVVLFKELYNSFKEWCIESGVGKLSKISFTKILDILRESKYPFVVKDREPGTGQIIYRNIRLN